MSSFAPLWQAAAAFLGLTGLAMGALAAHALADAQAASLVGRAATYQILHSLALLFIASRAGLCANLAGAAFVLGILLFCGSIYLKYLGGQAWASSCAPLGGLALMAGWLLTAFARPA